MSNAFTRVSVFCDTGAFAASKRQQLANVWNNQFADYWVPASTTPAQMSALKSTVRSDGWKMHAHVWLQISGRTAQQVADAADAAIRNLGPGCILLDNELADDAKLKQFNEDVYAAFRAKHPTFLLGINVAPNKGHTLADLPWDSDPFLYASEQSYYGDMSGVAHDLCMDDLTMAGIPESRASVCYGAALEARVNVDGVMTWQRVYAPPTIFYEGRVVSHLSRGMVFSAELIGDGGWL